MPRTGRNSDPLAEKELNKQSDSNERPSKGKKNKQPIMEQLGQTEDERRALRQQQRALQKDIAQSDGIENPESNVFKDVCNSNNELWKSVSYVREAVLDGDNLEMISSRATKQIQKLDQGARYDAAKFARKLREKCTGPSGKFDWNLLGREAGTCFNSVPSGISFLCGPMDLVYEPKERKVRQRRVVEEDAEEEKAEELTNQNKKDADKLSAVEQHIKTINKTLKKRSVQECQEKLEELSSLPELTDSQKAKKEKLEKRGLEPICAIKCLFNPKSFTQTVENVFHFSFLVRTGAAKIQVGTNEDDAGPKIMPSRLEAGVNTSQAIVALNMRDWKAMCEAFQVEESDVPHRTGSKHAKNTS